jgi:hypothetical protein
MGIKSARLSGARTRMGAMGGCSPAKFSTKIFLLSSARGVDSDNLLLKRTSASEAVALARCVLE